MKGSLAFRTKGASAADSMSQSYLTIIIPAKDEQDTLTLLYEKICATLEPLGHQFEIVFIDDGSRDHTFEVMKQLYERDDRIRVIRFNVNYGKSAAYAAGFSCAKGDIVLTIDADLQDDPAEIPKLLEKLNEGYDLISGWKINRHDPLSKRLFSKIFNYVVARASGIPLHDFNCGLKCYRREVFDQVQIYGEMHRFLPVIAGWYGFRIGEVPVTHHPRLMGTSKYGSERIIRGLLDFGTVMFFTRYVQRPSHLFGRMGVTTGMLGILMTITCLVLEIVGYFTYNIGLTNIGGVLLAIGLFLLFMGFQFFFIGLIAEMLTFLHRREEPPYFINERLER